MAGRPLPRPARVRGVLARPSGAQRRDRLHALLEQATASTSATSGTPRRRARARVPRRHAASARRSAASTGSGSRRRRRRSRARRARRASPAELRAAGLVNRRGNDYFPRRLLFPLADARGRVLGFQARKLREDDPLRAKYVNSPEGELFHKGDLLYGLDRARAAIAKQERAIVVEGNTDVLALRQAGLEPVVASMGTALTERQLKELARLTHGSGSASTATPPARRRRCAGWSSRRARAST